MIFDLWMDGGKSEGCFSGVSCLFLFSQNIAVVVPHFLLPMTENTAILQSSAIFWGAVAIIVTVPAIVWMLLLLPLQFVKVSC